MHAGKLTVTLFALAIILMVAVLPLRTMVVWCGKGALEYPTKAELEKLVRDHPQDVEIWLGLAECARGGESVPEGHPFFDELLSPGQAYEQAISLQPASATPYVLYASYLLAHSGEVGRDEEYDEESQAPIQRTAAEIENLHHAERLLKQARGLAPQNAASDYLLASIYLAEHKDEQALSALQTAMKRPRLNIHGREAAKAVLRLLEGTDMPALMVPTATQTIHALGHRGLYSRLRSLARTVVALGDKLRAEGKHQEAIVHYEATLHLGHVMRADAYSLIEGLVGVAITGITSWPFLSQEQQQQIEKETPITEDAAERDRASQAFGEALFAHVEHPNRGEMQKFFREEAKREAKREASLSESEREQKERVIRQREQRSKRMYEAHAANFTAYLRQHGRTDLAQAYQKDVQAVAQWRNRSDDLLERMIGQLLAAFHDGPMRHTWVVWIQAAVLIALWFLAGVVSVAARYWREALGRLEWSYGEWLLLLGIGLIAGQIFATMTKVQIVWGIISVTDPLYLVTPLISASIGIAVWLGVVLLLGLRKRARQAPDQRRTRARSYLASLRMLLPPTFAAFFLFSVIGLWPFHRSLQWLASERRIMIDQGEPQYWEIDSASDQTTDSLSVSFLASNNSGVSSCDKTPLRCPDLPIAASQIYVTLPEVSRAVGIVRFGNVEHVAVIHGNVMGAVASLI